jgi:hypothetical protein
VPQDVVNFFDFSETSSFFKIAIPLKEQTALQYTAGLEKTRFFFKKPAQWVFGVFFGFFGFFLFFFGVFWVFFAQTRGF